LQWYAGTVRASVKGFSRGADGDSERLGSKRNSWRNCRAECEQSRGDRALSGNCSNKYPMRFQQESPIIDSF
jgi:hypothetical protein